MQVGDKLVLSTSFIGYSHPLLPSTKRQEVFAFSQGAWLAWQGAKVVLVKGKAMRTLTR